jgi:hypothetical protein
MRDRHTEAAEQEREAEHQALTRRDHLLGLEAEIEAERQRSVLNLQRARRAERRFRSARNALRQVAGRLDELADQRRPAEALKKAAAQVRTQLRTLNGKSDENRD